MDWGGLVRNTGWELVKSVPSILGIIWPLLLLLGGIHLAKFARRALEMRRLPEEAPRALDCAACGRAVTDKVRDYCLSHPGRFKGMVYCYDHQRKRSLAVTEPRPKANGK